MAKLANNTTLYSGGKLQFIPSGSNLAGITQSESQPFSLAITHSGFSATGSRLNTGTGSNEQSYWAVVLPNNYRYKFWYANDTNDTEPTFSTLPSTPEIPTGTSYRAGAGIKVALNSSDTGNAIAQKTVEAFNALPHYATQYASMTYTSSQVVFTSYISGDGRARNFGYSASSDSDPYYGLPYTSSITYAEEKVDERNTFNWYLTSGSGVPNGLATYGNPDPTSQSFSIQLESHNSSSYMISSSNHVMYFSSSGKMGINTINPKNNFDIKADDLKFRSEDGKSEAQFTDGKMTFKKFATTASGHHGDIPTEVSGAEIVIGYTPGYFGGEAITRPNDVLGGITWEDLSTPAVSAGDDLRSNQTAMRLRGVVDTVATDGSSSISGKMEIGIGSREPGGGIKTVQSIHENHTVFDQGITISGSNQIYIGNSSGDSATLDRKMVFWNNDAAHRWAVGVDTSRSSWVVNAGSSNFPGATEDFYVKATGIGTANNLTVGGTIAGDVTGDLTGNADTATKIASITNADIVQKTSTQTLTNKTLTSPTLTAPVLGTPSSGNLASCTFGDLTISFSEGRISFSAEGYTTHTITMEARDR